VLPATRHQVSTGSGNHVAPGHRVQLHDVCRGPVCPSQRTSYKYVARNASLSLRLMNNSACRTVYTDMSVKITRKICWPSADILCGRPPSLSRLATAFGVRSTSHSSDGFMEPETLPTAYAKCVQVSRYTLLMNSPVYNMFLCTNIVLHVCLQ